PKIDKNKKFEDSSGWWNQIHGRDLVNRDLSIWSREMKSRLIDIPVHRGEIEGDLQIPEKSSSIVVFAHGSGSSRHSPRNKYVASVLNESGIATLLIDLLTPEEEAVDLQTAHLRFNIDLLADRLGIVTNWLRTQSSTERLHLGYFGASTGAA